jgi:hypothetical protein
MSDSNEEKKGLAPGWWIAIVIAILTVAGGITQAIISKPKTETKQTTDAKTTITFVGRVSDDTNKPLPAALILATVDQTVGQGIRTDSNGQFQIELPAETKAMSLIVSDDGFATETVQANIHRTGAEPIYLHRLPPPKPSASTKPQPGSAGTPPPTVGAGAKLEASDCGAINVGNNNVNNLNCVPLAFHMTDAQVDKAAKELQKHKNLTGRVSITYEWAAPDGKDAATQLQKLLAAISITAPIGNCGMCMEYAGAPSFPGLSFGNVKPSNRALADAIESALRDAAAIKPPLKREETALDTDELFIYLRKP